MIATIRDFSQTKNNKVNFEKLYIELKSSIVPLDSVKGLLGQIFVFSEENLTEDEIIELDLYISNHDGEEPLAFNEAIIKEREKLIWGINQLAIYSPYLPNNDETVAYLTSIDNYINGFIRSGNFNVLVQKIVADAQNPEGDFFEYLHKVVNEKGNKTYEYFIGVVTGQI